MPRNGQSPLYWGLLLITDEAPLFDPSYPTFIQEALRCGLRAVQLRAKRIDDRRLFPIGAEIRRLTRLFQADFIVNDRPHLARQLEADGVHVGQDDMPVAEARRIAGPDMTIGLSTHNPRQIDAARDAGADYIGVGPVYPTATKENPDPVAGLELVRYAAAHAPVPFVAIGGIDGHNLDDVLEAGAKNVAVISGISRAPDPLDAARDLLVRIERYGR